MALNARNDSRRTGSQDTAGFDTARRAARMALYLFAGIAFAVCSCMLFAPAVVGDRFVQIGWGIAAVGAGCAGLYLALMVADQLRWRRARRNAGVSVFL